MQIKLNDLEARVARIERIVANQVARRRSTWTRCRAMLRELRGPHRGARAQQRGARASSSAICTPISTSASAPRARPGRARGAAAARAGSRRGSAQPAAAASRALARPSRPSTRRPSMRSRPAATRSPITGFKDFLSTYPTSALAENAQYWLGEAYYVTHDYDCRRRRLPHRAQEVARLAQGPRCAAEARLHAVRAEAVPGRARRPSPRSRSKYPGTRRREARGRAAAAHPATAAQSRPRVRAQRP